MVATADAEFADFVMARSRSLHRAAYLMVGDEQLAQDLVQEALTRTYVAWPRLRRASSADAYARKAIATTAISWFRRRSWKERVGLPAYEVSVEGVDEAIAQREVLWRALSELPPRQRVVLVLRFYEDMSEAQTAEAMGCAAGTVKSQVSAGLDKLRKRLGEDIMLVPSDTQLVRR